MEVVSIGYLPTAAVKIIFKLRMILNLKTRPANSEMSSQSNFSVTYINAFGNAEYEPLLTPAALWM